MAATWPLHAAEATPTSLGRPLCKKTTPTPHKFFFFESVINRGGKFFPCTNSKTQKSQENFFKMMRTLYDVFRVGETMDDTKGNSTWNRFKFAIARGTKFVMQYELDDGTVYNRALQRLPASEADGKVSAARLAQRYKYLKELLVDGAMFDPQLFTVDPEEEGSDKWDEMTGQVHAIREVRLYKFARAAGGGHSIVSDRFPAFFPFLVHEDVPYDLTAFQMYRSRDERPAFEQTCLIQSILSGAEDLKIDIDQGRLQSVILRYVHNGAGNVSTKHLSDIGRALGIRFKLSRVKSTGQKLQLAAKTEKGKERKALKKANGRGGNADKYLKVIEEYRPHGDESKSWPTIPVALFWGHIFYNKTVEACTTHSVITVDCKNNKKTAASKGLVPRVPTKPSQMPQSKPRDTLWLLRTLESFGYIDRRRIDPRIVHDRPEDALAHIPKEVREEQERIHNKLQFDNIPWLTADSDDDDEPEGKEIKCCTVPANLIHAPRQPIEIMMSGPPPTYFYAGDCESVVCNEQKHSLYLIGCMPLSRLGNDVDIQTDVQVVLQNICDTHLGEVKELHERIKKFRGNKELPHKKAQKAKAAFYARLEKSEQELDDAHLVEVVIFFHNLRYDLAVLEPHVVIYGTLKREQTIYEVKLKVRSCPEILFVLRDSSKHLSGMSVAQMPKKMGLPAHLSKKSVGIYYEFFTHETRGNQVTLGEYIKYRPDKTQSEADALVVVNDMLESYLKDREPNTEYKTLEAHDVFCPEVLYRYYLEYDVLVLAAALMAYEDSMAAVCRDYLNLPSVKPGSPLYFPTSSSFSRAILSAGGAFDGASKYSLGLRAYIQKAVRGGRTNCHSEFEGKIIDSSTPGFEEGVDDLDGVSLYPSAIASLPGFPSVVPEPIPREFLSIESIEEHAVTAVVTVRITAIKRKLTYAQPILALRQEDGVMSFIQDLPNDQPFEDTIHIIDLQEYVRLHDIDYEILYGVWWKKKGLVWKKLSDEERKAKKRSFSLARSNEDVEPNTAWPQLSLKLYRARLAAKRLHAQSGDAKYQVQSEMIKLVMNSGFGGTILRISDSETKVRLRDRDGETATETYLFSNFGAISEFRETEHNVFIKEKQRDLTASYNICGVMILAQSRRILNRVLEAYEACQAYQVYSDTDSIHGPRSKTNQIAEYYNANRIAGTPELIGSELGQFHVDFSASDFEIYPEGLLNRAVSTWPKEAKAGDIFSWKLLLVRKKVYMHLLAVDYIYTCPSSGEKSTRRAYGMTCRCKGLTKKGMYHKAFLIGQAIEQGELYDPYGDEDLEYTDPTSRGLLNIFKRVLAGETLEIDLLAGNGDVRFYFSKGSVHTSAVPCTRSMRMSSKSNKRRRDEENQSHSNKRICSSMEDDESDLDD